MVERKPNPIIRREQITVDSTQQNDYGDLIVTTKTGNEYKVGKKREQLFGVFQPETEVVIGFSSYMNREYIAEATPANQVISTNTPIQTEAPKETTQKQVAPQEIGMWWKELGEMLRAGDINIETPHGKLLRKAYYAKMFEVLDIQIESKRKEETE